MIRLFRKIRHQLLAEDKYGIYMLYAAGEIVLVVVGILLALQIDNWNQRRNQKQLQIDNIENFYLSFNEDLLIGPLIDMFEYAVSGEKLWIDYLEGNIPYYDSLLYYGYYIGATASISPNTGFYESLQQKGLETIENKDLRNRLSMVYEQNFPEIQKEMNYFNERFSQERLKYFKSYFMLDQVRSQRYGGNLYYFDHSQYRIKYLRNIEDMNEDSDFLEFVIISKLFHENALVQLERILLNIEQIQSRIFYELNFLKYGTPKRRKVTLTLKGFLDAETVHVSGEFNNWRPDASMLKTPGGWERSYELFPGNYEYKFVIDGIDWILDPANSDSTYVPEVSSYNSVLYVAE